MPAAREPIVGSRDKTDSVRRRQVVADLAPMVALVLGDVEAAGRGGEGEPVAAFVDRKRVAIDDVIGVFLG